MTVQTSKITKKQRECLNLLVRLNSSITFRFNNRPSTVSFESDDATTILSELESIKAVLTPSQYAKLRMIFDESFVYTPRTRRTAVATPATPVVVETILEAPTPIQVVEPVIELLSEQIIEEPIINLNAVRGNLNRDAINEMTREEFESLTTTQMYRNAKQELPIDYDLKIVDKKEEDNPWSRPSNERTFTNPYAIKQPIKKVEEPDTSWNKYEDLSNKWYLSETIYKEEKDGFTLSYQNKISKTTLTVIETVYIDNDQYKAYLKVKEDIQNKRRQSAMMW